MRFEWDTAKAAANVRKNGVAFEEAETLFGPAKPAILDDLEHSEDELRYIAIGFSAKARMLTLSLTYRGSDVIQIIAARKSTRQEEERYAKAKSQNEA
jgi:uncharacterized protein